MSELTPGSSPIPEGIVSAVLESISDGVYALDRNLRFTYFNDACQSYFGLRREEVLGRAYLDVFPMARGTALEQTLRATLETGQAQRIEMVSAITGIPIHLRAFPYADGLSVVFTDVSNHYQAHREAQRLEAERAKQLETFDAVLASLQEYVYLFDLDGRFLYVNKPLLDLWGIALEEAIGKNFFDLDYPATMAEMLQGHVRQAIETRRPVYGDTDYTSHQGEVGSYEYTFVPIFAPDGSVESVGGHTRVVTEERRREAELNRLAEESERQRRLYETVLSNTPDLVYVWGLDHRFVYANASLLGMWSRTWDEAIGKHCLELGYEPWHAEMHDREIEQVVATQRPVRGVVPFDGAYGRRMYDYILVPVVGADGTVEAVAGTTRDVTDLIEVENALRKSDERLRAALEAGRMAYWTWNPQTERVEASDNMASLFGAREGETWHSSRQGFAAIHPEDVDAHRSLVEEGLRRREGWHTEYRVVRSPDAKIGWLEERAHVASDPSKPEVTGLVWDVTARKEAEQALRDSEERARKALNIETVGVLSFRLDGAILDANAAFERMSGWTLERLQAADHWAELTAPAFLGITTEATRALAHVGQTEPYEKELIRPDGSKWWGLFAPTRISGEGSEAECIEYVVDITEAKRAEAALRNSEEQLRTVFQEATDDAILLMDPERRLLVWNAGAERICGWSAEEAIGQLGDLIFTPEDRAANVPAGEATNADREGKVPNERWHVRKDGALFWGSGTMSVLCNPDGTVRGYLKVFRDATARHEVERKAEEIRADLERMVAERTQALEEAVREAEGFNYSIAHDLRSPLRAIVSTASILLEELGPELEEEHREMLLRQAQNANRLGTLIDELLRLSRLARAEVKRQTLDMTRKARDVAAMETAERPCRIEVQEGMTAEGDPGLVRMLLHNLIGNACKFSPEGGLVRVGQAGPTFWVKDEGVGFDMKYAGKLFLPFERLVTEAEFPGTGIGLANVERIVRRHGGKVWAESRPGEGATFFFTLSGEPIS